MAKAYKEYVLGAFIGTGYAIGALALDHIDGVYDADARLGSQLDIMSNFARLAPAALYACPVIVLGLLCKDKGEITDSTCYISDTIIDRPTYEL